jgi:hypothetical protein
MARLGRLLLCLLIFHSTEFEDLDDLDGVLVRGDSVTPGVVSDRCGNNGKIWRS